MGLQQSVEMPGGFPAWADFQHACTTAGLPIRVRMIDGLPAFPDEMPPESWQDVRIGTAGGMITLRRSATGVDIVTWGNAECTLQDDIRTLISILSQSPQGQNSVGRTATGKETD
jgi:hypothetical protein